MDNSKDIQKTDGLAKFVDQQNIRTNPFGENRVGERAYKRAERISAALVLLTNHASDSDPIKIAIRQSSISLLSNVLALRDEMRAINSDKGRELKTSTRKLISLVRLLAVGGQVSFQNAESITEALDDLSAFLVASQRSSLSESVAFSREDLLDVREQNRPIEYRGSERYVKDKVANPKSVGQVPGSSPIETVSAPEMSSRAQSILAVLRSEGELGIRDIASNLPEYSEKMIQRELVDLGAKGKVKKSGAKRWSRYSVLG